MSLPDRLEPLVQFALSEGARAAEVLFVQREGVAVSLPSGGKPAVRRSAGEELTVRVWVDGGRVGVQRGALDDGRELVGQALAATFQSPENPHAGPVGRTSSPASGLGTADRRHAQLTDADRIEVVEDAARAVHSTDARFRPTAFRYEDEQSRRALVNSRGLRMEEAGTRYRLDGGADGAGLALREFIEARAFSTVASLPLGTQLARRGAALLVDGQTLPAGPVRVVLPPLAVARLLAVLGEQFTPARLAGGAFFLTPDEDVVSDKLHLLDDGGSVGGLRTRAFDDRGVTPVPLTLLREGRLEGRFLDPETARALDTRPTGHCSGDGLAASNLLMRAGTRSINALLTELGGPSLQVDDLPDLSGLDVKTGAFDARVDGIVMDANRPVGAMRRVRLHGNLRDLLRGVVEVCNDTDRIGHVDAAAIIADGLHLG